MTPEARHVPLALSADALMLQWARQEKAPAGSALVVDNEIAARTRGGELWTHPESLTIAVIARPRTLEPEVAELAWLAGGIGVGTAFEDLTAKRHVCHWPDRVTRSSSGDDDDTPEILITASALLGPGRIEHIIVVARISAPSKVLNAPLVPVMIGHLRTAMDRLDEPDLVVQSYRTRCATLGERVSVSLLPNGTILGRACDVGNDASLVVESSTGMRERVTVAALNQVTNLSI